MGLQENEIRVTKHMGKETHVGAAFHCDKCDMIRIFFIGTPMGYMIDNLGNHQCNSTEMGWSK